MIAHAENFIISDKLDITPPLFHQDDLRRRLINMLNLSKVGEHIQGAIRAANPESLELVVDTDKSHISTADMLPQDYYQIPRPTYHFAGLPAHAGIWNTPTSVEGFSNLDYWAFGSPLYTLHNSLFIISQTKSIYYLPHDPAVNPKSA